MEYIQNAITSLVKQRVIKQCEGIAVSAIGKRADYQCRHIACVNSIFCRQHGSSTSVARYIHPEDAQKVIEDFVRIYNEANNELRSINGRETAKGK